MVENYYDMFEQKFDDATISSLSKAELESAIERLKDQILALPTEKCHTERTSMVQKLILLRLKIQEIEDFNPKSTGIVSMGHSFVHSPFRILRKRGRHCEVLIDWSIDWLGNSILFGRMIDWSIDWLGNSILFGRMIDWLIDWLVSFGRFFWNTWLWWYVLLFSFVDFTSE